MQTSQTADGQKPGAEETLVVRTMRLETGEVIKTMRVPWTRQDTDWPVNAEGYVESVKEGGAQWVLKMDPFAGGGRIVGRVESSCAPNSTFVTEEEQMITTCDPGGGGKLIAMSTAGGPWLWESRTASNTMWPLLVAAPNGSRLARETLVLKRPDKRYKHLVGADDLRGQMVRVMDVADRKVKLEAPVSRVLDGDEKWPSRCRGGAWRFLATARSRFLNYLSRPDSLVRISCIPRTDTLAPILPLQHSRRTSMNQTRALKIVLALVGILFLATIYPMVIMMRQEPALSMMLSLYATLGVFCFWQSAYRQSTAV